MDNVVEEHIAEYFGTGKSTIKFVLRVQSETFLGEEAQEE